MKRKIFSILFVISILFSSISFSSSASNFEIDNSLDKNFIAKIYSQREAMEIATFISQNLNENQYGGMYIDDNDVLNVNLTNLDYAKILEGKNVIIHKVEYTLHELNESYEKVLEIIRANNMEETILTLDEQNNKVLLSAVDNTIISGADYNKIMNNKSFKRSTNAGCIEFNNIDSMSINEETDHSITLGSSVNSNRGTFSLAFGCKMNGKIGWITAGHCGVKNDDVYSSLNGNRRLGVITKTQNSGSVDLAFIERKNGIIHKYIPKNKTQYSNQIINSTSNNSFPIVVGMACNLEGQSNGNQWGVVRAVKQSVAGKLNRITTSYNSSDGDSGGCVWAGQFAPNSSIYVRYIIGVHNGSYSLNGVRQGAYATNISYVADFLGSNSTIYYYE